MNPLLGPVVRQGIGIAAASYIIHEVTDHSLVLLDRVLPLGVRIRFNLVLGLGLVVLNVPAEILALSRIRPGVDALDLLKDLVVQEGDIEDVALKPVLDIIEIQVEIAFIQGKVLNRLIVGPAADFPAAVVPKFLGVPLDVKLGVVVLELGE